MLEAASPRPSDRSRHLSSFVDEVEFRVEGGHGGAGCVAFRRERHVPRGGPSGGDGGPGGSVTLAVSRSLNTLSPLRHHGRYRAEAGKPGEGSHRHGRSGESRVIQVPPGTLVFDRETGRLLADLREEGAECVVAAGGRGGRGNARFATATQRAPRHAQPGEEGEARSLRLELRLLADVGLVGLPNAGKSTLISRMSAARPRVAAHPFTTLVPNLGVVDWGEHQSYVVADIPGLIEGSHLGHGLGDRFLRHVHRTSLLLHLVDVSAMADPGPGRALEIVEGELAAFDSRLVTRPRAIVATKMDSADPERVEEARAAARDRGLPFHAISAVTGEGVAPLIVETGRRVEIRRSERAAAGEEE